MLMSARHHFITLHECQTGTRIVAALNSFNYSNFKKAAKLRGIGYNELPLEAARTALTVTQGVGVGVYLSEPSNRLLEASRRALAKEALIRLINIQGFVIVEEPIVLDKPPIKMIEKEPRLLLTLSQIVTTLGVGFMAFAI